MSYQPQWLASPIDLPEGKSGPVELSHRIIPAGEEVNIVGIRQAILRGIRPAVAVPSEPLRIHQLSHERHGMWMTDLPEELNQIAELIETVKPHDKVLIGGLGLGILATAVAALWPAVREVTVVEVDPDIIKLCRQPGYKVVQADIAEYLRTCEPFDYFLLDTWQGTNEGTWWETVMPLRRLIRNRFGRQPVIHCWAEDIMHGQLFRSLTGPQKRWYYENLPLPMKPKVAQRFLRDVGLEKWEERYGEAVGPGLDEPVMARRQAD